MKNNEDKSLQTVLSSKEVATGAKVGGYLGIALSLFGILWEMNKNSEIIQTVHNRRPNGSRMTTVLGVFVTILNNAFPAQIIGGMGIGALSTATFRYTLLNMPKPNSAFFQPAAEQKLPTDERQASTPMASSNNLKN